MSRYIDAKLVPSLFDEEYKETRKLINEGETHLDNLAEGFTEAARVIRTMPTADVEEVRHGEWAFEVKHFFDDYGDLNVYAKGYCSECKKEYPFNATIATEYVERPDDLDGYEHWDIDVEPIKEQVSHKAKTNKNLYPYCPYCGAKMDGERSENGKS